LTPTDLHPRPKRKPERPHFSSGPCAKRPGWSLDGLSAALVGRSHRAAPARARIAEVIERSKALLGLPAEYHLGIVPGSDTGAFELAMWSMLGARGVDVLAWDAFGKGWATDVTSQLEIDDHRLFEADYGDLPDLASVDFDRDVVFTWNGTTSGVCVPDDTWIDASGAGLRLCDATSAVFAMPMPWEKLDVITWSWQKVLGGEAAHGMLALSPRAVERLEHFVPPRPLPKIFRLTKKGALNEAIFRGDTINTPSMLCVEDVLDALRWAEGLGGMPALEKRTRGNLAAVAEWVAKSEWSEFLARDARTRSSTSICLALCDPWFRGLDADAAKKAAKELANLLEREEVAYDIASYRDAPPGIRLWGGATVERADLEALFPWLDWAFGEIKAGA